MLELMAEKPLHQIDIELFDLTGKRIKRVSKIAQGHSLQHSLDLSEVPNGLYAVKLSSEGKSLMQKFVKMK